MARGKKPDANSEEDEILQQLRAQGETGGLHGSRPLDGALLAMAVELVVARGGAIQFGCTKDGQKRTIKVWYKGFPTTNYAASPEETESILASTVFIFAPRGEAYDEWRTYAEEFR